MTAEDTIPDQPYAGMGCPKCGYDLTGTPEPRCPECGAGFDPAELRPVDVKRKVRWRVAVPCVLLAMYLPNTWIFWIAYPLNDYRITWFKFFPIQPALTPTVWGLWVTGMRDKVGDVGSMLIFATLTLLILVVCVLLGRRSKWWLVGTCVVMMGFQIFNAWVSHGLFRM